MENNNQPLVAIILVNYNGFEDTVACVESLETVDYKNYRIYVVDNASTQRPSNEQMEVLQGVRYVPLNNNMGFSGGNNAGICQAMKDGCTYFVLLNNDTVVTRDFLSHLVATAQEHPKAGCITGRIMFYYEQDKIWYAGGTYDARLTTVSHRHWGKTFSPKIAENRVVETEFASGCLMLLPRDILGSVGLLSEDYFLYAEDTDYCLRLRQAGYPILYDERSVIFHKVSRSTGATSANTQYYMTRNRLMIISKFGKRPGTARRRFLFELMKDVIKGRQRFLPVMWGILDFITRKKGKNTHLFS